MFKLNLSLFAVVFTMAMSPLTPAYAYLDPGTGSILIQLLMGGVAGAMVIVKLYWQRVKDFFSSKPQTPSQD
jgi:F0F1-type ATP synthase membrane subunit a